MEVMSANGSPLDMGDVLDQLAQQARAGVTLQSDTCYNATTTNISIRGVHITVRAGWIVPPSRKTFRPKSP